MVQFKPELGYTGAMALQRNLERFFKDKKFINPDGMARPRESRPFQVTGVGA